MVYLVPPIPGFFGGWYRILVFVTMGMATLKTKLWGVISPGFVNYCDTVKVPAVQNFDGNRYLGRWHEIHHTYEVETY